MTDELVFYTNPMSRGRIVRWMLEEIGHPYRTELLDFRHDDEGAQLSLHQSDGESADDPTRRYRRNGGSGHLRLSRRCIPAGRPRTAARDRLRGPYYRWLFFAAGPVEAAVTNKALGFVVPEGRERIERSLAGI